MRDPDLGLSVHAELTTPRHTWRAWRCVLTPSDSAAIGLDPDVQLNRRALMMPPIVLRFASYDGDDIGAEAHVESLVEATMRRELSPDDDCRRLWQARIGRRS